MRFVLICLLCLAVPAVAVAHRAPTKTEKAKINRAAKRSKQTAYADCVKVDNITVSTKGPWAGGTVRSCEDPNDAIYGVFSRKPSGRWKLRQLGNGTVGCDIVPKEVQRDLDLGCP